MARGPSILYKSVSLVAGVPEGDRPPLAKGAELRSSDSARAVAEDAHGVLGAH